MSELPADKFLVLREGGHAHNPADADLRGIFLIVPGLTGLLYPCKEIYVKRVGVPLGESYRPTIAERVAEDFLRLKPLYLLLRQAADEGMAKLDA